MSQTVYGVLGASFLWPWNAFITASSLAKSKLADQPGLYANYSSTVMTASTLAALGANLYLAYRAHNYGERVRYGEILIAVTFLVLGTIGKLAGGLLWVITVLFAVILSSIGCALVQNGVLAITQHIPGPEHALAVMNGQAVAGVLPPILPMLVSTASMNALAPLTFLSVAALSSIALAMFTSKSNRQYIALAEEAAAERSLSPSWSRLWRLTRLIWAPVVAIIGGFIVSLGYPVFANNVESRSVGTEYFSPLSHLVWNTGDLLGRILCTAPRFRVSNDKTMVGYTVARLGFIVLFVVLTRFGNPSDIVYLAAMLAYGITSGHLVSSAIAHAPSCVPEDQQPATGGLLGLVISVGLLLGSGFSFIVVALLPSGH